MYGSLASQQTPAEQELIALSKTKWQWMSDKNTDSLALLFHAKSQYVHMGGSWGRDQELGIIRSGGIWYKKQVVTGIVVLYQAFGTRTAMS